MAISPDQDSSNSASPFISENRNSATPFTESNLVHGPWRVLVIEDSIELAESLCRNLEQNGMVSVAAFSGEEGLALIAAQSFSAVLLDWRLPGCSGIDVLRAPCAP